MNHVLEQMLKKSKAKQNLGLSSFSKNHTRFEGFLGKMWGILKTTPVKAVYFLFEFLQILKYDDDISAKIASWKYYSFKFSKSSSKAFYQHHILVLVKTGTGGV